MQEIQKSLALPAELARKFAAPRLSGFAVRVADLDVDFGGEQSLAVTTLLAACSGAPAELFWELTLGKRIEALLEVALRSGIDELSVSFPCPACGQLMETPLPLTALLEQQRAVGDATTVSVVLGERTLFLKLPTGADLRRWSEGVSADRMMRELASLGPEEIPPEWAERIQAALSQVDPLVDFRFTTECPDCHAPVERPVDLESSLVAQLATLQRRLLDEIHVLAGSYHWSEADILAVPAHRRRRYLARIEAAQ
jgi:hypothetical protein